MPVHHAGIHQSLPMSDTSKQERIEEFLRKSLLGDELINTQFHLFSAKSVSSTRVVKPRVLCANNVLLAKSSKYFLDLLSSDINPSAPESLIDITGDNDIPRDAQIDDYGYGSDSDLEVDDSEEFPPLDTEDEKDKSTTIKTSPHLQSAKQNKDDDEVSDDDSDSVSSDMFVLSPETPRAGEEFDTKKQENESIASTETAIEEKGCNALSVRLRSLGSRHIFVKDTAFQTWYSLLNYLYTGKFNFLPLTSAGNGPHASPTPINSLDEPRCSAKSMYRLACKVGLDELRDEAFSYIRSHLTENNILQELSCSLASRYRSLLEMELDVLYSHISSPPVVAGFPAFARRIANGELLYGADIVIGLHARLLSTPRPSAAEPSLPRGSATTPSVSTTLLSPPDSVAQPSVSNHSTEKLSPPCSSAAQLPSLSRSAASEPLASKPSSTAKGSGSRSSNGLSWIGTLGQPTGVPSATKS